MIILLIFLLGYSNLMIWDVGLTNDLLGWLDPNYHYYRFVILIQVDEDYFFMSLFYLISAPEHHFL
jgi:hypothetical protein